MYKHIIQATHIYINYHHQNKSICTIQKASVTKTHQHETKKFKQNKNDQNKIKMIIGKHIIHTKKLSRYVCDAFLICIKTIANDVLHL